MNSPSPPSISRWFTTSFLMAFDLIKTTMEMEVEDFQMLLTSQKKGLAFGPMTLAVTPTMFFWLFEDMSLQVFETCRGDLMKSFPFLVWHLDPTWLHGCQLCTRPLDVVLAHRGHLGSSTQPTTGRPPAFFRSHQPSLRCFATSPQK